MGQGAPGRRINEPWRNFTNTLDSVCITIGKAIPPSAGPERAGANPFRTMMKAYGTFDIRGSVRCAAASCLAILSAELRLICP
jgi:hypothetical protein